MFFLSFSCMLIPPKTKLFSCGLYELYCHTTYVPSFPLYALLLKHINKHLTRCTTCHVFPFCWILQMPMRSGRRRGASEERRGRRPHTSPTRPERNDRQTVRAHLFYFVLLFIFRPLSVWALILFVHAFPKVMNNKRCEVRCVCC